MRRGEPTGSKRLRGDSWQLRAYAGSEPDSGKQLWLSISVPPRLVDGRYQAVSPDEADAALAKLVAKAREQQSARRTARHEARAAGLFGEDLSETVTGARYRAEIG